MKKLLVTVLIILFNTSPSFSENKSIHLGNILTINNQVLTPFNIIQYIRFNVQMIPTAPLSLLEHMFITANKELKPYIIEDYHNKKEGSEFKAVITFGDSIGDTGNNAIFMAGPVLSNKTFHEYLSLLFTNKQSVPASLGGLNFARAVGYISRNTNPTDKLSSQNMINDYLRQNEGKADKESIYIHWLGGINMVFDILKETVNSVLLYRFDDFINHTIHPENRPKQYQVPFGNILSLFGPMEWRKLDKAASGEYWMSDAPVIAREQIQQLLDSGAGYVFTGTISPTYSFPLTSIIPYMPTSIPFFLIQKASIQPWLSALDLTLREQNNIQGEENRIDAVLTAITKISFIDKATASKIYYIVYDLVKRTITQYNDALIREIDQMEGNIVFFDAHQLFKEIIEDPKSYGYKNILTPACTIGYFGNTNVCRGGYGYHDDGQYITTDMVHLTNYSHQLLAEYIISIFDAPKKVATIAPHLHSLIENNRTILSNQIKGHKLNQSPNKNYDLFFSYSILDSKNQSLSNKKQQSLHIGINHHINQYNLGIMISFREGKHKPSHQFNYDYDAQALTLFAQTEPFPNLNLLLNLDFYRFNLNKIKRHIQIGEKSYFEQGKTEAYGLGINALLNYTFIKNEHFDIGPILGLSIDSIKVKSYREKNNKSTSMHFNRYHYHTAMLKLGWRLDTKNYPVNTYIEGIYNHNLLKNNEIKVSGAINVLNKNKFERILENPNKHSFDLNTGLYIKPNDHSVVYVNYQKKFFKKNKNTQQISLGINYAF